MTFEEQGIGPVRLIYITAGGGDAPAELEGIRVAPANGGNNHLKPQEAKQLCEMLLDTHREVYIPPE